MRWICLVALAVACAAAGGCSSFGSCWGGTGVAYAAPVAAAPGCGCGP